jgi:RNA 2',3'-cyclic 3'-phosphodiesterase
LSNGFATLSERWFLALWPDPEARAALAARLSDLIPHGARATHPEDLHLTLAFLGPLSSETLGCVERAADEVRCSPFALEIDSVGYFARARVLWCGPSSPPDALSALVADLQGRLAACGLPADPRPYRPHMTIARRAHAPASADWPSPLSWLAGEFVLAAGYGGPAPRYRVRRRWPLSTRSR